MRGCAVRDKGELRMKRQLKWWIKERHNPQLGVYYVAMGQMSKAEARTHESTVYGSNVMLPYDTEEAYKEALALFSKPSP